MANKKQNKLSASLEDYLEVIFDLSKDNSVARSKDIAESLGVSRASVTGALRSLKDKNLANYEPYGYVTLTETGRSAARKVTKSHGILKSFFIDVLSVEEKKAQQAACKAEHALGPEIISRLLSYIEFLNEQGSSGNNLAEKFQKFYKNKSKK